MPRFLTLFGMTEAENIFNNFHKKNTFLSAPIFLIKMLLALDNQNDIYWSKCLCTLGMYSLATQIHHNNYRFNLFPLILNSPFY